MGLLLLNPSLGVSSSSNDASISSMFLLSFLLMLIIFKLNIIYYMVCNLNIDILGMIVLLVKYV